MGKGQLRLLTVVALQLSAAASRRDGDAAAAAAPDGHCDGDDCGSDLAAGAATDLVDEIPPLQLDDLDLDGFRESVSRGKWFIKFYAPWCKHCQALAPHWRDLAVKLHAGPDDVNVGKLDCTKAEDVCAAELVKGYPTLRFYEGDFHKDYRGVRALPAIETFINRALKPTTTAIASLEDLADAQRANQVIFVSFSARSSVIDPNSEGRPATWSEAFATAAGQARFLASMYTTDNTTVMESIRKLSTASASKTAQLFALKDGDVLPYPGSATALAITTWMKKHRYAAVVELTHTVAYDIKKEFSDLWIASLLLSDKHNNSALLDSYRTLAHDKVGAKKFQFTYMYYEIWKQYVTKRWQVNEQDTPALVILNPQTQGYIIVAKGEKAGSVDSGLDIPLCRDGLKAVVAGEIRWQESEDLLQWIRNSVFASTESALFMFAALQVEHPMLVHLTGITTSLLFAVLLKQCCCPNVSGIKSKKE